MARLPFRTRVFTHKWAHSWLPVAKRLHRQGNGDTNQCHLCKLQVEDCNHLVQCSHRTQWKGEFSEKLNKHLIDIRTDPILRHLITSNVRKWMNGDDTTPSAQDRIGWDMFLRGVITTQFTTAQERYYRVQHMETKVYRGTIWSSRVAEFVITAIHQLWRGRCNEVHQHGINQQSAREIEDARRKTTIIYGKADELLPTDRTYLLNDVPLQERLTNTHPAGLISWVQATWPIIQRSVTDARIAIRRGSQDIRRFFPVLRAQQNQETHPNTGNQDPNKVPPTAR